MAIYIGMYGCMYIYNIFRFINDLTALNYCDEFERKFREIYGLELDFQKRMI